MAGEYHVDLTKRTPEIVPIVSTPNQLSPQPDSLRFTKLRNLGSKMVEHAKNAGGVIADITPGPDDIGDAVGGAIGFIIEQIFDN